MHTVILQRFCSQRTSDRMLQKQIDFLLNRALASGRGNGWEVKVSKPTEPEKIKDGYVFTRTVQFVKTTKRGDENKQWLQILGMLAKTTRHSKFRQFPWSILSGAEELSNDLESIDIKVAKDVKDYGNIKTDKKDHFDHIYGRNHQIDIIQSAIIAAKESDFVNRFHCVLFGPPGCGKTDILLSFAKMLGEENDAYMKFDATSTTEAGASKILLESEHIPPIMIVEEIEKAEEKSLRWLLGVLDQRAEIRRTNFRIGNRARNVKMLCLATVNNIKLFRNVMSGALASRFAHQLWCPRPDREVLKLILEREVKRVKGDMKWIEPTLKFCVDDESMKNRFKNDPRKIVPICLCGRDNLLTGEYQNSVVETLAPNDAEDQE